MTLICRCAVGAGRRGGVASADACVLPAGVLSDAVGIDALSSSSDFRRHVDAGLAALHWRRDITIEKKRWEHMESRSRPGRNARNVEEHREPYTEDKTEWRTETQYVNGQAQRVRRQVTRQVIKIRKVYTYEVLVWRPGRTIPVSGEGQDGVRWPAVTLAGDEREGLRTGDYHARFSVSCGASGTAREYTVKLDEQTWRSLRIGATYRLDLGLFGGVRGLDPHAKQSR